jgi:hypothetical protein
VLCCCAVLCCAVSATDRFPASKMRAFVDKLHSQGQKWVPLHDAAIAKQKGYKAYEEGSRANVWVKDMHGHPYLGQVCCGSIYLEWTAVDVSTHTLIRLRQCLDWCSGQPYIAALALKALGSKTASLHVVWLARSGIVVHVCYVRSVSSVRLQRHHSFSRLLHTRMPAGVAW